MCMENIYKPIIVELILCHLSHRIGTTIERSEKSEWNRKYGLRLQRVTTVSHRHHHHRKHSETNQINGTHCPMKLYILASFKNSRWYNAYMLLLLYFCSVSPPFSIFLKTFNIQHAEFIGSSSVLMMEYAKCRLVNSLILSNLYNVNVCCLAVA